VPLWWSSRTLAPKEVYISCIATSTYFYRIKGDKKIFNVLSGRFPEAHFWLFIAKAK